MSKKFDIFTSFDKSFFDGEKNLLDPPDPRDQIDAVAYRPPDQAPGIYHARIRNYESFGDYTKKAGNSNQGWHKRCSP
jgi:hypothetical protein